MVRASRAWIVYLNNPCSQQTTGTLYVYTAKMWGGRRAWRAVLAAPFGRVYGTARKTVVETVENLLERVAAKLVPGEHARMVGLALQQFGATEEQSSKTTSLQRVCSTSDLAGTCTAPPGLSPRRPSANVTMVHQIYGLFRDGKPMSPLFCESKRRWELVAMSMGVPYHLWNADEVDTLVKLHYPSLWDTYLDVRYPVMRADIARVAILHAYGGLYSDLDIYPNRMVYAQTPISVCMCPSKYKGPVPTFLDMEVLVGTPNNPLLMDWLEYMRDQIAERKTDSGFWQKAKMRYIWHTTGPRAMQRFLKLPKNSSWVVEHLQCSAFWKEDVDSAMDLRKYDVLSKRSNSYFTRVHEIKVGVASFEVPLPSRAVRRRLFGKVPEEQALCHTTPMGKTALPSLGSQPTEQVMNAAAAASAEDAVATTKRWAVEQVTKALNERDSALEKRDEAITLSEDALNASERAYTLARSWAECAESNLNTASGSVFFSLLSIDLQTEVLSIRTERQRGGLHVGAPGSQPTLQPKPLE